MAQAWAGRISASVVGSATAAVLWAIAVIRWYPDARGLNRLYAGIFLGVAAWIALIFWSLLAASGVSAWRRVLGVAGGAGVMLVLHQWSALPG